MFHLKTTESGVASAKASLPALGRQSVLLEWLFSFDAEGLS